MPVTFFAAALFGIGLPWLSPLVFGPSSATAPWLVSLVGLGGFTFYTRKLGLRAKLNKPVLLIFSIAAVVYFVICLITGTNASSIATLVAWACVALMAWTGCKLASNSRYVQWLAQTWLVVALISCGFALLQYVMLAHWMAPWLSPSGDGAAYANLRQRNQFASLCGIGFGCIIFLRQNTAFSAVEQSPIRAFFTSWYSIALALLAMGTALSSSRTGALQWLLIAVAMVCWRGSLRADVRRLAYGGLAIYGLAVIAMPWFAQWVGNSNTGLLGRAQEAYVPGGGRMALYSNVIDLIALKPWFGWGWRELAYAHYSTHFDVRFVELLDNAHNLPLHLAVELGVPFALLFCGAVVWAIVRNAPWRETDPTRQLAWGILMLIGVHSMVEYPLWYGPFLMTTGLCIGLLQRPVIKPNNPVVQVFTAQPAMKYVATALLCITAYLAFDYHRVSQVYLSEADRSALYRDDVMGAAKRSVVFRQHAQFAELVTTPVTAQTAPHVLELALGLIHFSPEPRVIEPLIESATMLHFDDIAMFHLARYKAMYPKDYAAWSAVKP